MTREGNREGQGRLRPIWLAGACLLGLAACTDPYDPGQRSLAGAGIGAGSGAALGAIAGGGRGAAIGALAGGALGAVGGYATTPNAPAGQQAPTSPYYGQGSTAVAPEAYYGRDNGFRTPAPTSGAYVAQPQQPYGTPSGYNNAGYSNGGQVSY
jgi:hypothetical protein